MRYLWKVRRPQVTQAVSEAAALGDRRENANKEGKRELRSIDRRVRFLTKRLDELQIVDYSPQQEGSFGAYVEIENEAWCFTAELLAQMKLIQKTITLLLIPQWQEHSLGNK